MVVPELDLSSKNPRALFYSDAYTSFLYSQGNVPLQHDFFTAAAMLYRQNLSASQITGILNLDVRGQRPNTGRVLPTSHVDIAIGQDLDAILRQETSSFQQIVKNMAGERAISPKSIKDTAERIASVTMGRDVKFQHIERGHSSDPHASYFRQHVLLSTPAMTPTYTAAFKMAADFVRELSTDQFVVYRQRLDDLWFAWNVNHPGEDFGQGADTSLLELQ